MNNLQAFQDLVSSGEFHHVTCRNRGTVWEGLWVYRKSPDGLRGFLFACCVNKSDPDYEEAHKFASSLGVHIGYYGNG